MPKVVKSFERRSKGRTKKQREQARRLAEYLSLRRWNKRNPEQVFKLEELEIPQDLGPVVVSPFSDPLMEDVLVKDEEAEIDEHTTGNMGSLKNGDNNSMEQCVICLDLKTSRTSCWTNFNFETDKPPCLDSHLSCIFLLRKILHISKDEITTLFQKSRGVNPSQWCVLCESCSNLFRNSVLLHEQILELEKKLGEVNAEMRRKLEESLKVDELFGERRTRQDTNVVDMHHLIRECFIAPNLNTEEVFNVNIIEDDFTEGNDPGDSGSVEDVQINCGTSFETSGSITPEPRPLHTYRIPSILRNSRLKPTAVVQKIQVPLTSHRSGKHIEVLESKSTYQIERSSSPEDHGPRSEEDNITVDVDEADLIVEDKSGDTGTERNFQIASIENSGSIILAPEPRPLNKCKVPSNLRKSCGKPTATPVVQNIQVPLTSQQCQKLTSVPKTKPTKQFEKSSISAENLQSSPVVHSPSLKTQISHRPEPPNKCKLCPCKFTTLRALQMHKVSHQMYSFSCKLCNIPYQDQFSLKKHLELKHGHRETSEHQKQYKDIPPPPVRRSKPKQQQHYEWKCDLCPYKCKSREDFNFKSHKTLHDEYVSNVSKSSILNPELILNEYRRPPILRKPRVNPASEDVKVINANLASPHDQQTSNPTSPEHKTSSEEGTFHRCELCPYKISDLKSFQNHKIRHVLYNKNICTICNFPCISARRLDKHYDIHITRNPKPDRLKCSRCEYTTLYKRDLSRHTQSHKMLDNLAILQEGNFQCKLCSEMGTKNNMLNHLRECHAEQIGVEVVTCHVCGKLFPSLRNLRFHVTRQHENHRPYKCHICERGFFDKESYEDHIDTHKNGGKNTIICDICGLVYANQRSLRSHMGQFHSGKRKRPENRKFTRKSRTLRCKHCPIEVIHDKALKLHLKTNHPELYKYKCELCDAAYTQPGGLETHKKAKHSGEKAECPYCFREFGCKDYLKGHWQQWCKKYPGSNGNPPSADNSTVVTRENNI